MASAKQLITSAKKNRELIVGGLKNKTKITRVVPKKVTYAVWAGIATLLMLMTLSRTTLSTT